MADFRSIFAHSASAVTPSKKSSINTNRKSTTRFPMSLRWTSYVVSKPPKGWLKNAVYTVWTISCDNSETVQDRMSVTVLLITNRKSHTGFRLRSWWPRMTLNGITALILHFFTEFDYFAGQIWHSGWIQTYNVHKYCLPVPVFYFWP